MMVLALMRINQFSWYRMMLKYDFLKDATTLDDSDEDDDDCKNKQDMNEATHDGASY